MLRSLAPLVFVSVCSSAVTLGAVQLMAPPASQAAPASQVATPPLQAQRIEVVSATGERRALLAVTPTGGAQVLLSDADGANAVDLAATAGGAGIVLRDTTGRVRVQLGVAPDGTPSMRFLNESGQTTWQAQ